ncbi:cytidylyltransferase-like protein [Nitzschia inconspicua]|uniref:Cytidylyltransferase-like protein n=1 Tax=Nitzschia inconspicua TaxID=303405 RepID=A0A9K3KYD0_9STRA|nr:cytidylyltransferase-like protein [Nitzschia inconspicua]
MMTTTTTAARHFTSSTKMRQQQQKMMYHIPYETETGDDPFSLTELQCRIERLLQVNNNEYNNNTNNHKVCLAIAGGGGTALSTLAATSGASQLLLEGTVAYDRSSYQTFVRKNSSSLSSTSSTSSSNDNNSNNNNNNKEQEKEDTMVSTEQQHQQQRQHQPTTRRSRTTNQKFSYASMEAARLASMSALWRGMELQSFLNDKPLMEYGDSGGTRLTRLIGVGAASTLQTDTVGAKSRTGRPSFGNIVATRGDGQQVCMKFTLHHRQNNNNTNNNNTNNSNTNTNNPNNNTVNLRFQQDLMVSHLIVSCLEHFVYKSSTAATAAATTTTKVQPLADLKPSDDIPKDFDGVTVEQWSSNILLEPTLYDDDSTSTTTTEPNNNNSNNNNNNDPVEMAAHRILSGIDQAVLLLPKTPKINNIDDDNNDIVTGGQNSFLQPIVYPVLPQDCLIFPGSFNPPHHGHITLAKAAVDAVQRKRNNANNNNTNDNDHDMMDTSSSMSVSSSDGLPPPPPVVFELSIVNADKPPMDPKEVARRVAMFRDVLWNKQDNHDDNKSDDHDHSKPSSSPLSWGILLTSAPLFANKVDVLRQAAPTNQLSSPSSPSSTILGGRDEITTTQHHHPPRWSFVIGTDTMVRILNPKYYSNDEATMIQSIRNMDVDFVVGGRLDQSKKTTTTTTTTDDGSAEFFVTGESALQDLPPDLKQRFLLLNESDFRVDISSTELRAAQDNPPNNNDDDHDDDHDDDTNPSGGTATSPSKRRGGGDSGKGSFGLGAMGKVVSLIAMLAITTLPTLGLPACDAAIITKQQRPLMMMNTRTHFHDFFRPNDATVSVFKTSSSSAAVSASDDPLMTHRRMKNEVPSKTTVSKEDKDEVCTPVEKCQRCSFTDQQNYDSCKETGRWEKVECSTDTVNGTSSSSSRFVMRSCKYTEADEDFAMVRLQMLCFLVGSIAVMSVRKQKRLSASLFDQRKQHGAVVVGATTNGNTNNKRNDSFVSSHDQDDDEIEFTPMTNQEREKVPLMEINTEDDLEVV